VVCCYGLIGKAFRVVLAFAFSGRFPVCFVVVADWFISHAASPDNGGAATGRAAI